jgi:hypothetical protein
MRTIPKPGDRVGFVCGPCQNPRDDAGIVITTYSDQFYKNIALVLRDDGSFSTIVGEYTQVGIGSYLINPSKAMA